LIKICVFIKNKEQAIPVSSFQTGRKHHCGQTFTKRGGALPHARRGKMVWIEMDLVRLYVCSLLIYFVFAGACCVFRL